MRRAALRAPRAAAAPSLRAAPRIPTPTKAPSVRGSRDISSVMTSRRVPSDRSRSRHLRDNAQRAPLLTRRSIRGRWCLACACVRRAACVVCRRGAWGALRTPRAKRTRAARRGTASRSCSEAAADAAAGAVGSGVSLSSSVCRSRPSDGTKIVTPPPSRRRDPQRGHDPAAGSADTLEPLFARAAGQRGCALVKTSTDASTDGPRRGCAP